MIATRPAQLKNNCRYTLIIQDDIVVYCNDNADLKNHKEINKFKNSLPNKEAYCAIVLIDVVSGQIERVVIDGCVSYCVMDKDNVCKLAVNWLTEVKEYEFKTALDYTIKIISVSFKGGESLEIKYSSTDTAGHLFYHHATIKKYHGHTRFDVWYEGYGNVITHKEYLSFNMAVKFFKTKTIFKKLPNTIINW